jgi:hypothetical protein
VRAVALPKIDCKKSVVDLGDDNTVAVRGLTRGELRYIAEQGADKAEAHMVAFACDVDKGEAEEWVESTPTHAVTLVLEAITNLSGLDDLGKGPAEG